MVRREAELLAPAGSYETMMAAFHAGADAVYIGGSAFGARAYADNPGEDMLIQAIRYAHIHGKKLYLTVNTLLKEEELHNKLYGYLRPYYEEGLDAVIVQDLGVLRFIREHFPELPVHASTQMTITGELSAKHLEEIGVSRVVTARELSLAEIRAIRDNCSIEIESFVHGALCYCYSGQCLFSSIAGGRSGNRGRCAQPCRLPYQLMEKSKVLVPENRGYLLSPKDLNTIHRLPEILDAGVYSLKIEGRMKKPEYTSGVVSVYRKYLDYALEHGKEGYCVSKEDDKILFDLFNRNGFTDGYYFRQNGKQMITLTKPAGRGENEELNRYLRETYIDNNLKENINGKVKIISGESAIISLECNGYSCEVSGEIVSSAQNRPLQKEDIRRSMEKIRDTEFAWNNLEIETDGNSFYPVGKLNEFRRQALETLEDSMIKQYRRTVLSESYIPQNADSTDTNQEMSWYAVVETQEQLERVLKRKWIRRICLDSHIAEGEKLCALAASVKAQGKECFLSLPKMVRAKAKTWMTKQLMFWEKARFDGYLTSSAEGLFFVRSNISDVRAVGDYSLYAYTKEAEKEWKAWGADSLTVPLELNRAEMRQRGLKDMEMVVYGHLPMMISAQCLHQSSNGCIGVQKDLQIRDRMGNVFPVRNYCRECYNIIYNSKPLFLLDACEQLERFGLKAARLDFSVEDGKKTDEILDLFEQAVQNKKILKQPLEYTRGHWKRGVE